MTSHPRQPRLAMRCQVLLFCPVTDTLRCLQGYIWARNARTIGIPVFLVQKGHGFAITVTYVHCFMARYFVAIDLLRKLAFALEEGYTFDEEDPDVNVDMHCLFKNFAYGQRMETLFYAPHLKGSFY